jgi:uncharacterized protein (DUF427 family)
MKQAIWNGQVIAESDKTVVIEGNHYFPADSIKKDFFTESGTQTVCPWKGTANYYNVSVDGKENNDAAWSYDTPSKLAEGIKEHIAFWKGVEVK